MKKTLLFPILCAVIATLGVAHAQTNLNPSVIRTKNLVVDDAMVVGNNGGSVPQKSDIAPITIGLNRVNATYYEGEHVQFTITVGKNLEGYLYVFCVDSTNQTTCLYPNAWHQRNGVETKISGGSQIKIPADDNTGFKIKVAAPFGTDKVYAVISKDIIDPSKVDAKSFLKSDATIVNTYKMKALVADLTEQDSCHAEVTIQTFPRKSNSTPVIYLPTDTTRCQRPSLFRF